MIEAKELFGDELNTQVVEKLGTEHAIFIHKPGEKYVINDGNLIPRSRLNEETEKRENVQKLLTERDDQLASLKKTVKGNEELEKTIADLQKTNKSSLEKVTADQLLFVKKLAIKEGLLNAGVADASARDLLVGSFDLSKVNLDDKNQVIGFNDLLKPIKENKALGGLFGTVVIEGQEHKDGETSQAMTKLEKELLEATKKNDLMGIIRIKREIADEQKKSK